MLNLEGCFRLIQGTSASRSRDQREIFVQVSSETHELRDIETDTTSLDGDRKFKLPRTGSGKKGGGGDRTWSEDVVV